MDSRHIIEKLENKGVKATANRILVYNTLCEAKRPLSLADMEDLLFSLDKSSIFRVLTLFADNDVIHSFSDGRGVVHYELCADEHKCNHDNDHIHFYCEKCHKSYCFEDLLIPQIQIPDDYIIHDIDFVVKGVCPHCIKSSHKSPTY